MVLVLNELETVSILDFCSLWSLELHCRRTYSTVWRATIPEAVFWTTWWGPQAATNSEDRGLQRQVHPVGTGNSQNKAICDLAGKLSYLLVQRDQWSAKIEIPLLVHDY